MNNNSSKQILLSVLGVAILVVAVVGVSFAAFTWSAGDQSTKSNTVSTGTITMTYQEDTNAISIQNAMPMSESEGMNQSGTNQVFDFGIHASISGKTTINYAVSAKAKDGNTLDSQYVDLYVEEINEIGGTKSGVAMAATPFATTGADTTTGKPANEMTLVSGNFTATGDKYYRLKMWVNESYTVADEAKTFTVTLNAYAKAAAQ